MPSRPKTFRPAGSSNATNGRPRHDQRRGACPGGADFVGAVAPRTVVGIAHVFWQKMKGSEHGRQERPLR
jgi:hypothetical protein